MRKSVYFIIQAIWSFILSSVVFYLFLKNASFDFYGNSDNTLAGIILAVGMALYLILTVVYIIVGVRRVKEWRWWVILISVLIAGAMGFAGTFSSTYVVELLHRL